MIFHSFTGAVVKVFAKNYADKELQGAVREFIWSYLKNHPEWQGTNAWIDAAAEVAELIDLELIRHPSADSFELIPRLKDDHR